MVLKLNLQLLFYILLGYDVLVECLYDVFFFVDVIVLFISLFVRWDYIQSWLILEWFEFFCRGKVILFNYIINILNDRFKFIVIVIIIGKICKFFVIVWYCVLSMWRVELIVKDDVEVSYSISDIEIDGIYFIQGLFFYYVLIVIFEKYNKVQLQYFVFV